MMRSTPIKRKTPLHGTRDAKADREPWIKPKPRRDLPGWTAAPRRSGARKPKLGDLAVGEQPCFHLLWDGTP